MNAKETPEQSTEQSADPVPPPTDPRPPAPTRPSRDRWDKLQVMMPLLQAVVIAVLGFLLTGRVTNAIERGKLDLSNVQEMRNLILELKRPTAPPDSAEANAGALAMFGHYSIIPFLDVLENGESNQVVAAQNGLRAVALLDPAAIQRQMRRIVRNRSRLYNWRAHQFAIALLGEIEDRDALADLVSYDRMLPRDSVDRAMTNLLTIVRPYPPPDTLQLGEIEDQLTLSIRNLRGR